MTEAAFTSTMSTSASDRDIWANKNIQSLHRNVGHFVREEASGHEGWIAMQLMLFYFMQYRHEHVFSRLLVRMIWYRDSIIYSQVYYFVWYFWPDSIEYCFIDITSQSRRRYFSLHTLGHSQLKITQDVYSFFISHLHALLLQPAACYTGLRPWPATPASQPIQPADTWASMREASLTGLAWDNSHEAAESQRPSQQTQPAFLHLRHFTDSREQPFYLASIWDYHLWRDYKCTIPGIYRQRVRASLFRAIS